MYIAHYNLESKPFQISTDPNFLWLGEKHKEALATLKYAIIEDNGILALTGDVGTGKTTLINALIKSLGKDTMVATIYDPGLEILDFLNIVSVAFDMGRTFDSKGEFLIYFKRFLKEACAKNKKALLIIDEAQRITSELLEEIRLLSNLEDEHVRLLNIFFVGQNEFIDILNEYKNRALRQRITIRYHIEPLTLSETEAYTQHRLKIAGAKAPIFSSNAIKEIFSFSNGYPRMINIICDHALLSGYVSDIITINEDIVRECKEELTIPVIRRKEEPENLQIRLRSVILGIGLLAVIGNLTGYVFYSHIKSKKEPHENLVLSQDKTSYPKQTEEKNALLLTAPPVPENKIYPVPSKLGIGKVGNPRFPTVKDPEPKPFREIDTKKEQLPAFVPSKRVNGQVDIQATPSDDKGPKASDTATRIVLGESKITEMTLEKPKTIPPKAVPVTAQKKTIDKEQAKPEFLKDDQPVKTPVIQKSETASEVASANKLEGEKGVSKIEQKIVPVFQNEIKSEEETGDRYAGEDLQSHLNAFLNTYCRTYEKEQLDKFVTFFTPDAMEKSKAFTSRLDEYRQTFERIDSMNYRIDLKKYGIQEGTGIIRVEGIFHVRARLDGSSKWQEMSGPINMELLAYGDSFQIKRLDY